MPKNRDKNILLSTYLFCFMSLSILVFRMIYLDSVRFAFLAWNLFLALVPLFISNYVYSKSKITIGTALLIFIWLAFYPNTSYIVTDLIHLTWYSDWHVWFDTLLVFTFAACGLACANVSLFHIHEFVRRRFKHIHKHIGSAFAFMVLALSSYGVYLGRFLRLNSWEIISNPFSLVRQILAVDYFSFDFVWFCSFFFALTGMLYLQFWLLIGGHDAD